MAKRGRPRYPDVLTPREWEVLALIRDGLSNDAIASRLGISLDGVKYHVSEILRKLGLENRHDAARWRPDGERRAWALAPLSLWRRLDGGWLGNAVACAVLVVVAGGIGLLVWTLVATRDGDDKKTEAVAAPISTPYSGPLAAYAVVTLSSEPLAPLYLKAIDPFTGAAVPGRQPLQLGHDGTQALSPDGSTIALGWAAADTGGSGPYRLSLLDIATWTKHDTNLMDGISQLFWSPDSSTIYVVTFNCNACNGAQPRLITVDARTGNVASEAALPYGPQCDCLTRLSPGGQTLYLFGRQYVNPDVVTEPPPPHLAALDVRSGSVRADLEFPDMLFGWRSDPALGAMQYGPAWVITPDGRRILVAYPDSNRIAVVNVSSMRIERTVNVQQQASLIGNLLALFSSTAGAKDGATTSAGLSISADGRFVYYSRSSQHLPFVGENGLLTTTIVGPWIIDPPSLRITRELPPGAMENHGLFSDVRRATSSRCAAHAS